MALITPASVRDGSCVGRRSSPADVGLSTLLLRLVSFTSLRAWIIHISDDMSSKLLEMKHVVRGVVGLTNSVKSENNQHISAQSSPVFSGWTGAGQSVYKDKRTPRKDSE